MSILLLAVQWVFAQSLISGFSDFSTDLKIRQLESLAGHSLVHPSPLILSSDDQPLYGSIYFKSWFEQDLRKAGSESIYEELTSANVKKASLGQKQWALIRRISQQFFNPKRPEASGMDAFLDVMARHIFTVKAEPAEKSSTIAQKNQLVVRSQLGPELMKSLEDSLGTLIRVDATGSRVQRLIFLPKKQNVAAFQKPVEIVLSLSSLLSYELEQDAPFVERLEALSNYFHLQRRVFAAARNLQVETPNLILGSATLKNLVGQLRDNPMAPQILTWSSLSQKTVQDAFGMLRDRLFEDVPRPEPGVFVQKRLQRLDLVIPYFEKSLVSARQQSEAVRTLPVSARRKVLYYLIGNHRDMILGVSQLRSLDRTLEQRLLELEAKKGLSEADKEQKAARLRYEQTWLHVLNHQLEDFIERQLTERKIELAHQKELERIRKGM